MNLLYETRDVSNVFTFGTYLGVPPCTLRSLEEQFPHNLERRRAGVLSCWLESNVDASWEDVLTALKKMRDARTHERIKQKICKA